MCFFKQNFKGYKVFLQVVLFSLLTVSCTIQTEPTTLGERSARAAVDKAALFGGQEEIIKPITLYEAIARAIKYNSDQRVALMEQAVAYGIAESSSIDLLPQLAAGGGFATRSNRLAVSAKSVETGSQTLEESYIEDKSVRGAQLQVVYNVLDFGISYVNARQASDKRYVSEEIRRKSVQQVVHEVRTSFWKAAAAQRIIEDMGVLIAAVQDELVRVNDGSLSDKTTDQLKEQKKLLTALKSLMDLRNDILTAKAELGALMNLPPNAEFVLDIPPDMDNPKIVRDLGQIDLEHFALVNRPELRINDYEARIAALEAKKEMLRLFPGIEFGAGVNYNSNSYLKNKNWADAGIGVTWNLMNLFSRPQAIRLAKSKEELERLRRLAMTMAVMSQVNISYLQLRQAAEGFEVANSLDKVNDGLWQKSFAEKNKTVQERRETLFVAVDRLVSHLKRDFAYADYKGAESNLFVALGVDPLPRFIAQASVHSIAETLEDNLSRNAPRGFKDVSYDRPPSDRAHLTALSKDQRAKLLEWSGLRRVNKKGAPLAQRAVDDPVVLKGAVPSVKKRAAGGKARKDENNNIPAGFKLLQLSSFAQLDKAQIYWQELVAADPALAAYSPIYREVNVSGKMRFRTFIADTESRLRDICRRLAAELKSCLIVQK
ncbi:MAG: TolC family protein [Alphaproteobacteria bacterium]|nr:TolC family protein [Alphaproteobacteria bacterium]